MPELDNGGQIFSKELTDLLRRMLEKDPKKRITAS